MKWRSKKIISALCCSILMLSGAQTVFAAEDNIQTIDVLENLPASDSNLVIEDIEIAMNEIDGVQHEKTIESGVYTIDSAKYNKSFAANGSKVSLKEKTVSDSMKFRVKYTKDGKYKIYADSGKGLSIGGNIGDKAKFVKTAGEFYIDRNANGTYTIASAENEQYVLRAMGSNVKLAVKDNGTSKTWKFDKNVSENEAKALSKLTSVQKIYPHGKNLGGGYSFNGGYQCMGFGREVFYRVFGEKAAWSYDGTPKTASDRTKFEKIASSSSYSSDKMKKLISKACAGDVLQMNAPKIHTMIYVSSDKNGFTVYDANWIGANRVSLRYVRYSDWQSRNSRGICLLRSTSYPAK